MGAQAFLTGRREPSSITMLSVIARRTATRVELRAFAASPWGTEPWRHDKDVFKAWATAADKDPVASAVEMWTSSSGQAGMIFNKRLLRMMNQTSLEELEDVSA